MQTYALNNWTCKPSGPLCVPAGDDRRFVFTVRDQWGQLVDISGAQEIRFVVAAHLAGVPIIDLTYTGGDIGISTNLYQFWLKITSAESLLLPLRGYYEIQLTNSDGDKGTIRSGPIRAPKTMIEEIV